MRETQNIDSQKYSFGLLRADVTADQICIPKTRMYGPFRLQKS